MFRIALASTLLLVSAGSSRADTLPVLGLPSGYTPGQDFSFSIFAPGLTGLMDYTLQFTVTAGSPPNLPDLSVTASANGLADYPFPNTDNFGFAVDPGIGVNGFLVTITDSTSGLGVNTFLGVNDHLATVTISPGVNLSGPITVEFTLNQFSTARDVGFTKPDPFTIEQLPDTPPAAVPAPPAWILLGLGGLCLAGRNR